MGFLLHRISNNALKLTLSMFSDYAVEGFENIPVSGPLIVVANHQSNVDPPILAATLSRNTRFLAKDSIFKNVTPLGVWFLRSYGAHPLKRGQMDLSGLRWALKELERPNATLALFPEGTRNPGAMKKAASGIVPLATRAGIPILPVGITGVEEMTSWLRVFKPKGTIRVRIGQPFLLNENRKLSKTEIETAVSEIMGRVALLLPPSYRGVYAEAAEGPFTFTKAFS
ncbi:MAG: lysophospholipid acyltransferase family protein [Dehalococcoidia bacterium]